MDKEIRDDRTPNNLSQPLCTECSYPYNSCDCEEMDRYEREWMEKQKKDFTLDK